MLVRKNTKVFKLIQEIITAYKDRPDRAKFVRLYITKAGHSIKDKISVEGIEGSSEFFYDINYDAVWNNLSSPGRQLHSSDDIPGIYFFRTNSNKAWDETPFEFDETVKKDFPSHHDIAFRKKERVEKFILPAQGAGAGLKEKHTVHPKKVIAKEKLPVQPDYKLKHKIQFTDLDEIVFTNPRLKKRDVLDYYDKIAVSMLPHLKNRPLEIRMQSKGSQREISTLEELAKYADVPDWFKGATHQDKRGSDMLFCNDKDHLLWYAEIGALEFYCGLSQISSLDCMDYIALVIGSDDSEIDKTISIALATKAILSGLQIPSFAKTDGRSAFHIYLPLQDKSKFENGKALAEYIWRLVRLKLPGLISLEGADENKDGKISFTQANGPEMKIVAPYSLITGESPFVATPVSWEIIQADFQFQDFTYETVFKDIKKTAKSFENIFSEKTNAVTMLKRIEANYSFLL